VSRGYGGGKVRTVGVGRWGVRECSGRVAEWCLIVRADADGAELFEERGGPLPITPLAYDVACGSAAATPRHLHMFLKLSNCRSSYLLL
jgi:hypothetical protein